MTGTKALSVFGLAHTMMSDATKKRLVQSFGKQSHNGQHYDFHHENLDLKAFIKQRLIDSVDCGPFENELTKPGSLEASIDQCTRTPPHSPNRVRDIEDNNATHGSN